MALPAAEVVQVNARPDDSELFFDVHRDSIRQMFDILDIKHLWAEDLDTLVGVTQPWARGDHSRPNDATKQLFTPDLSPDLQPIYARMGLLGAYLLQDIEAVEFQYGATALGNQNRFKFTRDAVEQHGFRPQSIEVLAGERRPFPERETKEIVEDTETVRQDISMPDWARRFLDVPLEERWETDLARLAMYAHLGGVVLERFNYRSDGTGKLDSIDFDWNGTPLTIHHCLAVQRAKNSAPRHNTNSCTEEVISKLQLPDSPTIAVVAAGPHVPRMGRVAARIIKGHYPDADVLMAGPAMVPNAKPSIAGGEVARMLWEDQQQLRRDAGLSS